MAAQSGNKTIEEVLGQTGEPGLTIEEALAGSPAAETPLAVNIPPGVPMATPRVTRERPQGPEQPSYGTRYDQRQRLLQGALMGIGSIGGGLVGSALAGTAETGAVGGMALRSLGEMAGTTLGGLTSGMEPSEAARAGVAAGGIGGATEAALQTGGRLVAATTSVPGRVVAETMKLPAVTVSGGKPEFPQAKALFRTPKGAPEMHLGRDVLQRIDEAYNTLSPGRLTKIAIRDAAQKAGVKVPIADLDKAIQSGMADADMAAGRANVTASSRLQILRDSLARKFPSGELTPKQADAQLQALQRDADMAAARNNPFLSQTYRGLKDTLRKSFFGAVDKGLPGSNIAAATKQANDYMSAIETLDSFMSRKTPESFIRAIEGGGQDAQSARDALKVAEEHLGTGGKLMQQIDQLGLKRAWTAEETGRGFSVWRALEKIVAKPLAKAALLSSRPAGYGTSAATAFYQAMQKKETP